MKLSTKRHLGNILISIIPSSLYILKNKILNWMNVDVAHNSKVNIGCKFYGVGPVIIGKNTWVGPNCKFYTAGDKGIYIGDNCDIAPDVSFVCGSHEVSDSTRRAGIGTAKDVTVSSGCWLGCSSTILTVKIGVGVIVAAGSVVVNDSDDNVLIAGLPAKKIKVLNENHICL